jgi:hypothetical protein
MQSRSKLLIAALALAASTAYAEDKPQVFRASFQPEATQKYLTSINLTHLPIIEGLLDLERAPFLGKGSLDITKPFGVMGFVVDPNPRERWLDRTFEDNGALILPVNKNFATVESVMDALKDRNADAALNGNTVTSRQGNFKRTDNYLLYSRGQAITQINDSPFAADYKPGVLASATIDLAALRKSGPKLYDALLSEIAKEFRPGPHKLESAIHEAFVKFARVKIDSIDTANFVITGDDQGLRASSAVAPMNIKPTAAAFPRPTFPTTPAAELHVAYPDAKSSAWLADIIGSVDFASFAGLDGAAEDGGPDAKQFNRIKENVLRGVKLFTAADATSLGVTLSANEPVLLIVNQYARDIDAAKELAEIAAASNAIAAELKATKIFEVSAVDEGGSKFTRVLILDREKIVAHVDVAQNARTVAFTYSEKKLDALAPKLLAAKPSGKLDNFITFTVNLKELVELGEATRSLSRREAQQFKDFGNISLTATAKSDDAGKSMIVESSIPSETAKQIGATIDKLFARNSAPVNRAAEPVQDLSPEEVQRRNEAMKKAAEDIQKR